MESHGTPSFFILSSTMLSWKEWAAISGFLTISDVIVTSFSSEDVKSSSFIQKTVFTNHYKAGWKKKTWSYRSFILQGYETSANVYALKGTKTSRFTRTI